MLIIAIYGISAVYKKLFPDKDPKELNSEYEKHIHVAEDYLNVTPEVLKQVVEDKSEKRGLSTVIRTAIDFFRPAKLEPNVTIEGIGGA